MAGLLAWWERLCESSAFMRFVDVNLRAPWWQRQSVLALLEDADWVKLNRDELALLGDGGTDEIASAERFRATHGLRGLVLTRGSDGALALEDDAPPVEVRPGDRVQVVDAVGAGDAFLSLTAPCVVLGAPMDVVGFVGNVAGAEAVATVGHRRYLERERLEDLARWRRYEDTGECLSQEEMTSWLDSKAREAAERVRES